MDLELQEMQNTINKIFVEKLKDYQGGLNLSFPCIPRVSKAYLENRVVIVGQETYTWYNETDDDLFKVFLKNTNDIENICLSRKYDVFVENCVRTYPGKFWSFNRQLYDEVFNKSIVEGKYLSHVWLNLFPVESIAIKGKKDGSPTKNSDLAHEIMKMQGNLLYEVLSILEPKLILFLTGPDLDRYLFSNSICTSNIELKSLDKNSVISPRILAEIKIKKENHPLFNSRIVRSYHPSYFLGYINRYKSLQSSIKEQIGAISNSKYYNSIFIESLKDIYSQIQ